jgi:hypothetical protein
MLPALFGNNNDACSGSIFVSSDEVVIRYKTLSNHVIHINFIHFNPPPSIHSEEQSSTIPDPPSQFIYNGLSSIWIVLLELFITMIVHSGAK